MHILRPGDLRSHAVDVEPERRVAAQEQAAPRLTPEWISDFDRMPASRAKHLYETDSVFHALADELFARRSPKGGRPQ
jgi:hypothetical protein